MYTLVLNILCLTLSLPIGAGGESGYSALCCLLTAFCIIARFFSPVKCFFYFFIGILTGWAVGDVPARRKLILRRPAVIIIPQLPLQVD